MKKKLQSNEGFSLSEMLMAVLIMALFFTVIGGGIVVIKDAYGSVVRASESQTLLATTLTAVTDELRNAENIETVTGDGNSGSGIYFDNYERGYRMCLTGASDNENDSGNIYIKGYGSDVTLPLITDQTKTDRFHIVIDKLSYEAGVFVVRIEIKDSSEQKTYASQEFTVRPLNQTDSAEIMTE